METGSCEGVGIVVGGAMDFALQPWFAAGRDDVHPWFEDAGLTWRYGGHMDVPAPLTRVGRSIVGQLEYTRWLRPLVLGVLLVVLSVTSRTQAGQHRATLPVMLVLTGVIMVGAGLLVFRRLTPLTTRLVFAALVAASVAMVYLDAGGPGYLGGFVAVSLAAAQLPRTQSVVVGVLALVTLGAAAVIGGDRSTASVAVAELGAIAFFTVGWYSRRLRERTEQAASLRLALERGKVAQARAALLAERQRLAREMHDVLAHSLSGLMLHIESARLLAAHDPADPRLLTALERANQLAHSGLDEARQAIGMLRNDELPCADSLSTLVEGFRADSGIPCEFEVSGPRREIDAAAGLAVYRVAQEALTNIRKHAEPDLVRMRLDYADDGVRLSVADVGRPVDRAPNADRGGYGLSGMRERAELIGGSLDARRTDTGFLVELWVPTP
jgi:signal transduction histidine kinase